MGMINEIKNAIESMSLDDRVEIKVLVKDLILILDKEIDTMQSIVDVFVSAEQLDYSVLKESVVFFQDEIDRLNIDLEFFEDVAKSIEIKYDSL